MFAAILSKSCFLVITDFGECGIPERHPLCPERR
jgi:hypothetical protein